MLSQNKERGGGFLGGVFIGSDVPGVRQERPKFVYNFAAFLNFQQNG